MEEFGKFQLSSTAHFFISICSVAHNSILKNTQEFKNIFFAAIQNTQTSFMEIFLVPHQQCEVLV